MKQASAEVCEGETYRSGIGMAPSSGCSASDGDQRDDFEISAPVVSQLAPLKADNKIPVVFFDVETTSLGPHAHIVQLAARTKTSEFSQYVLSSTTIDARASNVTGLTVKGAGSRRQLCKDGQLVASKSLAK